MVIFVWGAAVYFKERTPPRDSTEVYVVAKQWMWKLEHAEGQREINELHVPVGRDVKLIMTSQDVIHSFFVPAFRIKQDVLPGRYTVAWFRATKPGVYHLFCAEYCGTQHSGMVGSVIVMEPAQYEAWMSGGHDAARFPRPAEDFCRTGLFHLPPLRCRRAAARICRESSASRCDLADGRTVMADENYIRECILDPGAKMVKGFQPIMPTFQGLVSEEQVNALVAYIKSLSAAKGESGKASASTALSPAVSGKGSQVNEYGYARCLKRLSARTI